ncbi:hypothetical protein D3C76_1707530 [compost metagenome]
MDSLILPVSYPSIDRERVLRSSTVMDAVPETPLPSRALTATCAVPLAKPTISPLLESICTTESLLVVQRNTELLKSEGVTVGIRRIPSPT